MGREGTIGGASRSSASDADRFGPDHLRIVTANLSRSTYERGDISATMGRM